MYEQLIDYRLLTADHWPLNNQTDTRKNNRGAALWSFNVLCMTSAKLRLGHGDDDCRRKWWEGSQRSNLFPMKDKACQYSYPSLLSPLYKHPQSTPPPPFFCNAPHSPCSSSSLSSEPLPLRSDRGQHFSILQHTVCTLTDALTHTTNLHQDVTVPASFIGQR